MNNTYADVSFVLSKRFRVLQHNTFYNIIPCDPYQVKCVLSAICLLLAQVAFTL